MALVLFWQMIDRISYMECRGIDWESLGFSVVGTAQNGKEIA